jgi:carboxyl-terminal processing protease
MKTGARGAQGRSGWLGLLLWLAVGTAFAAEIRNVTAIQQADRLVVTYDLVEDNPVDPKEFAKACASTLRPEQCAEGLNNPVAALFAINGHLYPHESLRLEGDVGRNVEPGKGRRFSWNIQQDFPQGIAAEVFVNVSLSPKKLRESDVVSLSDQQAEIFRRIDAERIAVADANRRLVLSPAAQRLANRIDETLRSSYVTEPDEAHLEKSRYYCARFSGDTVASAELAAQWEKRKGSPPPPITDGTHEKYFNCLLASFDPHSAYLTPEAFNELKVGTKGEFGGLGIEVGMKKGMLVVVAPIEDTPAFRAGILAGDLILEIDGKPTTGMSLNDAVKLMRGQKGTRITLTLQREGQAAPLRIDLVRAVIMVRSVRFKSLGDGHGYIRIAQFQERTADDVGNALASLKAENGGELKGLVLDLRNDPGGLLNGAISVASRFIDSGLIVSTQGRTRDNNHEYPALRIAKEPAYPMAVLINGGSASASEIVAGALQDHRRATVIGAPSFGKGTVQTIVPVDQAAIKLTTAGYYTPSGKSIQQIGIVPDIALDQDATLDDGSIAFAQRLLRETAGTRNLAVRKDLVERLKVEEFFALYKNAVRASVAVGQPAAATGLASARPASRPEAKPVADRPDEHRVALVIGNSSYPSAPLKNPVNDARAISAKFRSLGFDVIVRENVKQKDMTRAITQFGEKLAKSGTVGIFYYAGHGMQVRGKNYLIPVDAQISSEASVRSEAVDVDSLLEQLATSALGIVILDACRNNPFERRFRGASGGLAQMDAPKGTLIAYATAPGKVASDGDGRNGLYTQEFLRMLDEPGLKVEDVFKRVRRRVADATADQQVPWESSSLTGDFYFVRGAQEAEGRAPDAELLFWQSIRESRDAEDFSAYLKKYPDGQFADIAKNRLKALAGAKRR